MRARTQVLPVVLVFLISGLQLDTKDMRAALSARNLPALAYGLIAILAITPLLGFVLRELPLEPKEFATGAVGGALVRMGRWAMRLAD